MSWGEGSHRETLEISSDVASIFAVLGSPVPVTRLLNDLSCLMGDSESAKLVEYLADAKMLLREEPGVPASERRMLAMNWNDALVMHRATRQMLWRHEYPANAQIMTWTNYDVPVPVDEARPTVSLAASDDSIRLSEPRVDRIAVPLSDVLSRRRTKRSFGASTLPEWMLSTLMHAAFRPIIQGVTRRYYTTLSSADGYREQSELHPVSAHVIFRRPGVIPAQAEAAYRYNPETHALQVVHSGERNTDVRFSDLLWGQDFADEAPAAVVLSINWRQFMWKYRSSHVYRFAHYDVGAFMQTAQLVATALGMRTFLTPAMDDVRIGRMLASIEHAQAPAYLLAVGTGRERDSGDDSAMPYL